MGAARTAALILASGIVVGLAACGGDDSSNQACAGDPAPALSPPGSGSDAFTMGIRVNQTSDVDDVKSSLGDVLENRDFFMVNTEFSGSSTSDAEQVVDKLTDEFPCNRIASLNGLGTNPNKPSYAYALADHPEVDAILVDWEEDSYEDAGLGSWSDDLEQNLPRISKQLGELSKLLESSKARMGLVPDYLPPWDYGRTARVIALENFELDPTHLGYQIVQTQPNCGTPADPGPPIGPLAKDLIGQYRPLLGRRLGSRGPELSSNLLRHLAVEIAFDVTPNPKSSEAVARIGPKQAAVCSEQVLGAGGGAILYWATPESIRAMLETPIGRKLRSSS